MQSGSEIGETSIREYEADRARFERGANIQIGVSEAMLMMMLIAAVMVSLAFGVLVAYGICYSMFQMFRIHSRAVKQARMQARLAVER